MLTVYTLLAELLEVSSRQYIVERNYVSSQYNNVVERNLGYQV